MRQLNYTKLVSPRSMAVVGANDRGNSGARAIALAQEIGFAGPIYPVNPRHQQLQGLKCYPNLGALPEVPDLAIISTPRDAALAVLADAEAIGAPAVVLFGSGFADAGTEEGARRHREVLAVAARSGMAVAGPNCMGLMSLKRKFNASFVSGAGSMIPGDLSIVSQSGGLINALVELGSARAVGFNYLISTGNEAVVHTSDHLDWLCEDPGTRVIVSILESVSDGPRFRATLERACRSKPVILLKLGRTPAGQQAIVAHTGALIGSEETFSAVCAHAGATLVETLDQALETATLMLRVPLPRGERPVIFSTSGGATALTTDIASRLGIAFAPLSEETNKKLQAVFGAERPFINPFDVGSSPLLVKDRNMTCCLEALVADPDVDLVACVLIVNRDPGSTRQGVFDQAKAFAETATKPILLLPEATLHWRDAPPEAGSAYIASDLADGLFAIKCLFEYARFRRRDAPTQVERIAAPEIRRPAGRNVLMEFESKAVLAAAGLPVTREIMVHTREEAVRAADAIGYPVALKVQSPDLVHKTDSGGVALGLKDAASVRTAFGLVRKQPLRAIGLMEQLCNSIRRGNQRA